MTSVLKLIDADRVAPQAWRNGGGSTRELLAWPAGAQWRLRLSLADITRDGPFSAFDGVERWFAVLSGAGVRLLLDNQWRELTPADAPLRFDGAAMPDCQLIAGPTRDLNLMLRGLPGVMAQARVGQPSPRGRRWRGLFTADAVRLERVGQAPVALGPLTLAHALVSEDEAPWMLDAHQAGARAWWLDADIDEFVSQWHAS